MESMKDGTIAERDQIRRLVHEILDRIDEAEIKDLETVVDKTKSSLSDYLERCKLESQKLRHTLTVLGDAADDTSAFIAYTRCQDKITAVETVCSDVTRQEGSSVTFKISETIESFLSSVKNLGTTTKLTTVHTEHVFKVADCKKRCIDVIGVKGGKDVKWVEYMCELHFGKIVAACFKDPCTTLVLLDT